MKKKINRTLMVLLACALIVGCNSSEKEMYQPTEKEILQEEQSTKQGTGSNELIEDSQVEVESQTTAEVTQSMNMESAIIEEDYGKWFQHVNGCAVIYNETENEYHIYNKEMVETEVSPYSTFKIIATLMGLENHVLENEDTTMEYNGTIYPIELWNHNLTLYEAFQASCVWYFRQVIDRLGYDEVQLELEELDYGNHDISQWAGIESDGGTELNGFWLNASLKISPMEQVQVLKKIFNYKSRYTKEQVELLKKIMLTDERNGMHVLGKTGTGASEGWYVGVSEGEKGRLFFAVYIEEADEKQKVSGAVAREILLNICENM